MTSSYTYNNYSRPDQYRTDEQRSEQSASPEKLYQFVDNKENAVQELKGSINYQRETRSIKEMDLSPGNIRGSQAREYNITLKDKTNLGMINNGIPIVESQNLARSQTIGVEDIHYAPPSMPSMQRFSTLNRSSTTFQLNRNDIVISVTDPARKGEMFKHTFYCIQGSDKEGEFKVTRSHDDFIKIRTVLVKRWPGCYVPSVPPKRVLTKMVPAFLEGRRKEFEMFVQKITELPYLHYSREYQRFLRAANLDEELATFQKVAYDDIILRYKTTFKQALQLTATPEAERKIDAFKEFLKTIHSNFKNFKKVLKKTTATRQAYYEQLVTFHDIMSGGYEKDVLTKLETNFESKPVFYNTEAGDMTERVAGVKQAGQMHSIEYLHAWIKAEAREIKAFLEAVEQKEFYDDRRRKALNRLTSTTNKLERTTQGKSSFASMFSGKSRDSQISTLQGKVLGEDKEAKQLQLLYDTIVLVMAHNEIDRFKERKSEQYHNVVNLAAQYELANLQNLVDYWSTIISLNPAKPSSMSLSRVDNS